MKKAPLTKEKILKDLDMARLDEHEWWPPSMVIPYLELALWALEAKETLELIGPRCKPDSFLREEYKKLTGSQVGESVLFDIRKARSALDKFPHKEPNDGDTAPPHAL